MRPRGRVWLAWGLAALSVVLMAGAVVVTWLMPESSEARDYLATPAVHTVQVLGLIGAPLVGAVIVSRRPDSRYGWLLLSLGVTGALLEASGSFGTLAIGNPGLRGGEPVAMAASMLWLTMMAHLPLLLLLFPDGRLPSPRWRWLGWAIVTLAAIGLAAGLLVPGELGVVPMENPWGVGGPAGEVLTGVAGVAVLGLFVTIFAAGLSVFSRRRRAGPQERLQLRWFGYAALLLGGFIAGTGGGAFIADPMVNALITTTTLNAVFVAIGVAVLKYRLYEIDRLVSRTVTYAIVTAILVGIYVGMVAALQAALQPVAGQSDLAVAASTLLVAALFGPVRRRVQAVVDRRFNRSRYDAARASEAFGQRLRNQVDLDVVKTDLGAVLAGTVEPKGISMWLRREAAS